MSLLLSGALFIGFTGAGVLFVLTDFGSNGDEGTLPSADFLTDLTVLTAFLLSLGLILWAEYGGKDIEKPFPGEFFPRIKLSELIWYGQARLVIFFSFSIALSFEIRYITLGESLALFIKYALVTGIVFLALEFLFHFRTRAASREGVMLLGASAWFLLGVYFICQLAGTRTFAYPLLFVVYYPLLFLSYYPILIVDDAIRMRHFRRLKREQDVRGLIRWQKVSSWLYWDDLLRFMEEIVREGEVDAIVNARGIEFAINAVDVTSNGQRAMELLETMAKSGLAEELEEHILSVVDLPCPYVKVTAVRILGIAGSPRALPALERLLKDNETSSLLGRESGEESPYRSIGEAAREAIEKIQKRNS